MNIAFHIAILYLLGIKFTLSLLHNFVAYPLVNRSQNLSVSIKGFYMVKPLELYRMGSDRDNIAKLYRNFNKFL